MKKHPSNYFDTSRSGAGTAYLALTKTSLHGYTSSLDALSNTLHWFLRRLQCKIICCGFYAFVSAARRCWGATLAPREIYDGLHIPLHRPAALWKAGYATPTDSERQMARLTCYMMLSCRCKANRFAVRRCARPFFILSEA